MFEEMTVSELKGLLEEQPEDARVRVVHQRAWPLQEVLGGITTSGEIVDEEYGDEPTTGDSSIVYLVASGPPEADSPYGPGRAWDVMRRGL